MDEHEPHTAADARLDVCAAAQPARGANIQALVDHFASGCKEQTRRTGIELELTLVHQGNQLPVSYYDEGGARWLLGQLMDSFPQAGYSPEGDLIAVSRPGATVTLEPAGQVELSAGPFASMAQALECFSGFEVQLSQILRPLGIEALATGYHPSARATSLTLIPKDRYRFMNAYLGAISPYGPCMMRGSGSTQVSIDYTDEQDCIAKLRTAAALTPLLSLITDNAPVFEGAPRPHHLMRTLIWRHCDPARCGTQPGLFDPDYSWERYAEWILDTPAIVAPQGDGYVADNRPFGTIYATTPMDPADADHALGMVFPDVRLKSYVEIRPADALPAPYAVAYAALIKGLFTTAEGFDQAQALVEGITATDINAAKTALMATGYHAHVYGRPATALADELARIAAESLTPQDQPYLAPLAALIESRQNLSMQ